MNEVDIAAFLVENLRLELHTENVYCGSLGIDGSYSRETKTVKLMLGDKCISEVDVT